MKIIRFSFILFLLAAYTQGCGILGKRKSGCPQGRNVGAERVLAGEKKALKITSKKSKLKI